MQQLAAKLLHKFINDMWFLPLPYSLQIHDFILYMNLLDLSALQFKT